MRETHRLLLNPLLETLHPSYGAVGVLISVYEEAIACRIRRGAPLSIYSIQRRCLREYPKATENHSIQSPVCLMCACSFPYVHGRPGNELAWKKPFVAPKKKPGTLSAFCTLDAWSCENAYGLETYLVNYGLCKESGLDLYADQRREE